MKWKRNLVAATALALVLVVAIRSVVRQPAVSVNFLNVGQGDAALIRAGTAEVLVDAGPDRSVLSGLGQFMPFFDRTIETVLVTHPHADHYEGLAAVLERYRVQRIVLGPHDRRDYSERFQEILTAAEASGTVVVTLAAGDAVQVSEAVSLVMVWPPESAQDDKIWDDENNQSLVTSLEVPCAWLGRDELAETDCSAVLLTGDINQVVEDEMLAAATLEPMPVFKVAHHGSGYATGREFLAVVRPVHAVISVGRNSFGHPSRMTLNRLAKAGVAVVRTETGAARAEFGPAGFCFKSGGDYGLVRFWSGCR